MPKLYCSHCGQASNYSEVKPSTCPCCSESYVKKVAIAAPVRSTEPNPRHSGNTATRQPSLAERIRDMEAVQGDIPASFDIRAVGAKRQKIIVGSTLKEDTSFERGNEVQSTGFAEADRGMTQSKQDALKHLLNPGPAR